MDTRIKPTEPGRLLNPEDGPCNPNCRQPSNLVDIEHVPAALRHTLTYDRGKEMATHERLAQRLAIRVFFADPQCPWQRGTNEHTNGLLRQYVPKGTDLSGYNTQRELNAIAYRLNTRPRKCLTFATPLEVYAHVRHHSPVALGT